MKKPLLLSLAAGLVAVHGVAFLGAFVYGWENLDAFARLTHHFRPPGGCIDNCDPAWGTSTLTWFLGFVVIGLAGQFLLLAAAGLWVRSRWSGPAITLLSALQLLLGIRLLVSSVWWLGLLLLPLPLVELTMLRFSTMAQE